MTTAHETTAHHLHDCEECQARTLATALLLASVCAHVQEDSRETLLTDEP